MHNELQLTAGLLRGNLRFLLCFYMSVMGR